VSTLPIAAVVPGTLSLPPIVVLAGLLLSGWISASVYWHVTERRRLACDGCRIEAGGGMRASIAVPHSCSRRKALYLDKTGQLWQFGKPIRSHADQAFYRGRAVSSSTTKREEGSRVVAFVKKQLSGESDRKVVEAGKQPRRAELRSQRR
jgi:hypothetical protein